MIDRRRIFAGWAIALAASAVMPLWGTVGRIQTNALGKYVDPETGRWTAQVYWQFLHWWLPIAIPVSLLALACLFLDRRSD